jgi:murein L,D-transpeptidase YcbB/YkuD
VRSPLASCNHRRRRLSTVPEIVTLVLLILCGGCTPRAATGQDDFASTTRALIAAGRAPWARWPDFGRYRDEVTRLYELGASAPVWLDGLHVSAPGQAAIASLLKAGEHGLDPRDYDADALDRLAYQSVRVPLSGVDRARFDVLLSVNLIRFLDDLQFGRLHPRTLDRGGLDLGLDLAGAIRDAVAGDSIPRLVSVTAPQLAQYRNLQRLLASYQRLAADSSPGLVSETPPVQVGDRYADAVSLRRRLAAVGDLQPDTTALAEVYTEGDAAAVRRFQTRHGLAPSGVLDSATTAEIDIPFQRRARQIELALERLRWLPPIGRQRFVVVNIPAFQLFAFDSAGGTGAPGLSMRVIVGNALDTKTPVLFERMRYVEFRPYWNVPLSIAAKEIIPLMQRDPGYLSRNDMELVGPGDSVIGSPVTSETFERLSRGELRVRQRPGARNPLGLIKFVFPNSAAVYLHGTPRPDLFAQTRRDFSHGCIRVEQPTVLALWVLRDLPRWNDERIAAAQEGTSTTRAWLSHPMPVIVFYTTAVAAPNGDAWFYSDIYGHDRELDEALRGGPITP